MIGFSFCRKSWVELQWNRYWPRSFLRFCGLDHERSWEKKISHLKESRMTCLFWRQGKKANCCNTIYSLESFMFTLFYSLLSLYATTSLTLSKNSNFGRRLHPILFLSGIKVGNPERTGWAHRAPRLANQKTGFASYNGRCQRCNNVYFNASQNVLATCYELEVFPMLIFVSRHLLPWYQNSAIICSNNNLS